MSDLDLGALTCTEDMNSICYDNDVDALDFKSFVQKKQNQYNNFQIDNHVFDLPLLRKVILPKKNFLDLDVHVTLTYTLKLTCELNYLM